MNSRKQTVDCARIIDGAGDDATALAFFSAAIAYADNHITKEVITALNKRGIEPARQYEIVLQSYLFCGFPRMLEALFNFSELIPAEAYLARPGDEAGRLRYSPEEVEAFEKDGRALIRRVYAEHHEKLERAVTAMSPEVYRWMVMEGYGKTLSRPGLDIITRELAVIGALTVDRRARQLRAHLRGVTHVGAEPALVEETLSRIEPLCDPDFHTLALNMFAGLREGK